MTAEGVATLHARSGRPLADQAVRDLVVATAVSIGERLGRAVRIVEVEDDRLTIAVDGGDLAAVGLVSELRRATDRWHRGRFGSDLWDPLGGGA